jgi:hypothetical protein
VPCGIADGAWGLPSPSARNGCRTRAEAPIKRRPGTLIEGQSVRFGPLPVSSSPGFLLSIPGARLMNFASNISLATRSAASRPRTPPVMRFVAGGVFREKAC